MGSGGGKGAGGAGPGTADGTGNGGGSKNGKVRDVGEHVATGEVTGTAEGISAGLSTDLHCAVRDGFGSGSDAFMEMISGSSVVGLSTGSAGDVLGKRGLAEGGTGGGVSGMRLFCVLLSDFVSSMRAVSGAS